MTKKQGIPVLAASQFDPGMGRIALELPEGLTITDILCIAMPGATEDDLRRTRVALVTPQGSSIVDPAFWPVLRPKPGVRVVIRIIPGKGVFRAVLSIVVAVTAVALGAMFGGPLALAMGLGTSAQAVALGAAVIGMGVNLVGQLLINALVPPVQPDREKQRSTYSISGWKNRLEPDGAVPFVLGSIRYAPPFAARPYTEIVGDWQYLRCIFAFGEGRVQLTDWRIGETSLSEYDEVQIEVRQGLPGDLPLSIYPQQIVEEAIGVELTRPMKRNDSGNPWEALAGVLEGGIETPVIRTTGTDARRASVILAFPAGLVRFNDEGKKRSVTVSVRLEQRLAGATEWQPVKTLSIKASKLESFYRQHTWTFPQRGRWEIRATMMTDESDDSSRQQRCVWAALQTIRPEYPLAYPRPLTLVSVRVKATHQLSGALDNLSAIATRICPDWDHETQTWVTRATSNPASLFRLVLQHPSNPKAVLNTGLYLDQLQDWHDFCRIRGLEYNRVQDQTGTTLRDVLTEIAAAGRATPRHDGMGWGVVIDRPSDLVVDHITPRNSWSFKTSRAYAEKPHALVVTFQDQTNDFKEAKRTIRRPGYTGEITLTEPLELPGITDPALIYREAIRRWYEVIHRPDVYEVTQDGAARVATRGDTVVLSHDVLSRVQATARVKAVIGTQIHLDDSVTMYAPTSYAVRFRYLDASDTVGQSIVRTVATEPGNTDILTVTGTGRMPQADDLILFGPVGRESIPVVITQTEATEDMATIIRAVDAAPQIDTLTDATAIPAWSGRVGAEIAENLIQPPAPRWAGISSDITTNGQLVPVEYLIAPGSGPVQTAGYEVSHRLSGASSWTTVAVPVADGGGAIAGYDSGQTIQMRARAVSPTEVAGPYGPTVTHLVGSGGVGIPGALDAESISVTALLGGGRIEFAAGSDANLARVQLYRSMSASLDRATDKVGQPREVSAGGSFTVSLGDNRPNLLRAAGWSGDAGWTAAAGELTHAPGAAGDISQAVTLQVGRWYRLGMTIAGRSAGTLTPRLTGGSPVPGPAYGGNGLRRERLQAVTGNNRIELAATAPFDGSVAGLAAYLETPACLAQGTHYLWLEPQSEDGLAGPAAGPFILEVI